MKAGDEVNAYDVYVDPVSPRLASRWIISSSYGLGLSGRICLGV